MKDRKLHTVKDLVKKLKDLDQDAEIFMCQLFLKGGDKLTFVRDNSMKISKSEENKNG